VNQASVAKSASGVVHYSPKDLEPLISGEEPFLEAIKALGLGAFDAKVRVMLADSQGHGRQQRFLAVARVLTSGIDLRAMSHDYPASALRVSFIADTTRVVYRLRRTGGTAFRHERSAVVRRYLNFFDEVWQTSMPRSQCAN